MYMIWLPLPDGRDVGYHNLYSAEGDDEAFTDTMSGFLQSP